jgi:hypothetical protein
MRVFRALYRCFSSSTFIAFVIIRVIVVWLTHHTPVCTPYDISIARCHGSNTGVVRRVNEAIGTDALNCIAVESLDGAAGFPSGWYFPKKKQWWPRGTGDISLL